MNYPLNPLMYKEWPLKSLLYTTAGTHNVVLEPGYYEIQVCGGGGAGGESGQQTTYFSGVGGAGAPGKITKKSITINTPTAIQIVVGAGGLTYSNGGNGGAGGAGGATGGGGGGGGHPTYIEINGEYIIGEAGGGGGAGGGSRTAGRLAIGSGGGGGGGYYHFTNGQEISYPGKAGGNGGVFPSGGQSGTTGYNIIFTSDSVFSGASSSGSDSSQSGAYGKLYCGASGAGGGAANNKGSTWAGAGGGGAPGSPDAGGGGGGGPTVSGEGITPVYYYSRNAANHYTTPISTTDYMGNTVTTGWGIGGDPNANGAPGWVYIKQLRGKIDTFDQGQIIDEPIETSDLGILSDQEIRTQDNGEL